MGLFSRRKTPTGPPQPFAFVVANVFSVPMRGVVFTGRVESGQVQPGQDAVLHLAGDERAVRVKSIDVRRRSAAAAGAGEEAGLYLDGITARDLPTVPGGDGSLIDSDAVAGTRLVSA
ncbi:hypothetical protein [Saccharopolyspora kobensis]|uniref:hypothetical protein n=1 Tax=Saccharopolyspora kobensis TaxID=146035 RepID=UPI0033257419